MNRFKEMSKNLNPQEKKSLLRILKEKGEDYNIYPLSSEQARMWYMYNLDKENPYYNVLFTINMQGKLDLRILNKTLKAIMMRNKVLTTKIVVLEGEAFQYITDEPIEDLNLKWVNSEADLRQEIAEASNAAFDLEEEFPVRFCLFHRDVDQYVLTICIHHMYVDGWSMRLFYEEFKYLYREFCREGSFTPEIPTLQYADYAKKECQSDKQKEKDYWQAQLEMASFYLDLPLSYPRRKPQVTKEAFLRQIAPNKELITQLCKKHKISVFSFFLSVYFLTLRKCCAQENITVGTPILNRNTEDLNSIIGYFSNSIPLNVQMQVKEPLDSFLKTVNQRVMEGLDHGALQFDELVDMLQVKRKGEENPIFQVMFSLHNHLLLGSGSGEKDNLENLSLSLDTSSKGAGVQFEMLCTVIEERDQFVLDFAFQKALFSETRRQAVKEAYQGILLEILENDKQSLADYGTKITISTDHRDILENLILKKCAEISDCRVQFHDNTCLVYYLSSYELGNKYFVDLLTHWTWKPILSLRLPSYPLTPEGALDRTILMEKSSPYLQNMLSVLQQLRKIDPIDTELLFYIDKEKQSYYKRLEISAAGVSQVSGENYGKEDLENTVSENYKQELSLLEGESLEELSSKTLADVLLQAREDGGNFKKITTINFGNLRKEFNYHELIESAKTVAGNLQSYGIRVKDKIILEINPLDEFIKVFWGCLLAGATVIPLDIPRDLRVEEGSAATGIFLDILKVTEFPLIIADQDLKAEIGKLPQIQKDKLLLSSELLGKCHGEFQKVEIKESDIALILFTSGSTGVPKGVMLCHRNIIKRSQGTILSNLFHDREVSLNWMPLSHVGGIVMFHILDTVNRAEQIQVETRMILEDPLRWLLLLDEFQVTSTWAPNFAYGLITEQKNRVKKLEVSLNTLKFILNGGEAINFNSCQEFMKILEEKGLGHSAMKPSWGMTETSSGILFSNQFGKLIYKNSVAVGKPIPGVKIRIVDKDGALVPKGNIGILQISGETVNKGYYKRPEESERSFSKDYWFDTGDFALLLEDEVVITGRAKEIVIVNGVNVSCLEVEKCLEEIPEIQTGTVGCAAIPNPETNEDSICIFYGEKEESSREYLKETISLRLMKNFGINYDYLVPLKGETIPRTSIGKIEKPKLVKVLQEGKVSSIAFRRNDYLPQWFAKGTLVRKNILRQYPGSQFVKIFSDSFNMNLASQIQERLQGHCQAETVNLNYPRGDLTIGGYGIYLANRDLAASKWDRLFKDLIQIRKLLNSNRDEQGSPLLLLVASDNDEDYNSLLEGFCSSIPLEYENISVKCVTYQAQNYNLAQFAEELFDAEMKSKKYSVVKYLNEERYVEIIKKEPVLERSKVAPAFIPQGQYIVIGGLGGIGRMISRTLLENYQCKLILIGRTKIEASEKKQKDLAVLQELGEVSYYSLNIGERGKLNELLQQIQQMGSQISGIISLIGEEKSSIHFKESNQYGIPNLTVEQMKDIILPRLIMMEDIDEFLMDKNTIDVLVFSSTAAFFGGRTYSAYAGISKYLYHFNLRNPENTYRVFAWSKWENIGMSEGETIAERMATEKSGYHIIDLQSGLCSLEGLLARGYTRAVIGLNLKNDSLANYRDVEGEFKDLQLDIYHNSEKEIEPDLPTYSGLTIQKRLADEEEKSDSLNQTELKLMSVWHQVLGRGNIKLQDSFFGIGGNSLKSIKLVAKMNEVLGCSLSIVDLFTYSSIGAIAVYLNKNNSQEQEPVVIDI